MFGFIVYYFIPSSILSLDFDLFFLIILCILFIMVIGMAMISQSFVATIETAIVKLLIFLRPSDKKLKPIIDKNMNSHRARNMKTSLMFTMAVCFLMYANTSFAEMEYMIFSLTGAIAGADIALFIENRSEDKPIAINEAKLVEYFEANKYSLDGNGGLITGWNFLGQTVNEVLTDAED